MELHLVVGRIDISQGRKESAPAVSIDIDIREMNVHKK